MKFTPLTNEMKLKPGARVREPLEDGSSYKYATLGAWVPEMRGFFIRYDENAAQFSAAGVEFTARQDWMVKQGVEILINE